MTPRPTRKSAHLRLIGATLLTGTVTLIVVHRVVEGAYLPPWTMVGWYNEGSYLDNIKGLIVELRFWYPFVWLLPLGVWKLRALPPRWRTSTLVTTAFALFMAVLSHLGGTVNRAVFNVIGPILSLSAALLLSGETPNQLRKLPESPSQ